MPRGKAAAPAAEPAPASLDITPAKPNGKARAQASKRVGTLTDAGSARVEQELAALEDQIVAEDKQEARRAKARTVDTELEELPDETEEETEQPDEEETEEEPTSSPRGPDSSSFAPLLEAFSKFESRVAGIEQFVQNLAQREPETEEEPFTIGPLPEGFDVLDEPMKKLQGYFQGQLLEIRHGMQGLATAMQDAIDEIHVDQIRKEYKVAKAEEDEFCVWADDHGIAYENPRQLEKALQLYRKVEGKASKAKAEKVAPETALQNPKSRPTGSRTFDKDLVRKPGRSTFDDAFNHAVQVTNQAIRTGALS